MTSNKEDPKLYIAYNANICSKIYISLSHISVSNWHSIIPGSIMQGKYKSEKQTKNMYTENIHNVSGRNNVFISERAKQLY